MENFFGLLKNELLYVNHFEILDKFESELKKYIVWYNTKRIKLRACLNFAQPHFEGCFRGYFSVVMRIVAGYVTNNNRKRDRKEAQKGADIKRGKFKQALRLKGMSPAQYRAHYYRELNNQI